MQIPLDKTQFHLYNTMGDYKSGKPQWHIPLSRRINIP